MVDYFSKAEWSNGAIATGGKSYDSTTQNGMIAKMPHAALKAAFHVSGITDMYAYNYKNGVPYANGITFTPRYAQTYGSDGEHPQGEPFGTLDAHGCQEMAEHVASGTGSAASGQKDAYWIERDWTRYIAESKWEGSIFFVHGFQDWNVKPDHILPWIDNLPQQIRVKGWLHQDTVNGGHVYPMRADWNATFISWLDAELKGFHNEFWDGAAWQIEATDGIWRDMEAWPPTRGEGLAPSASVSTPAEPVLGRNRRWIGNLAQMR
jgi:X-Pro dipeptidyl-peptidase